MKNKPLSKIVALALTVALVAMMVAPAFATESLYISNSYLNVGYWWTMDYFGTVNATALGRTFVGNNQYLSKVVFYLANNTASESGTLRAVLFNTTSGGEPVDDSIPVAYSNVTYDVAGLTSAYLVEFTFTPTFLLSDAVTYGVALEVASPLGSSIKMGMSLTGGMFYDGEADRHFVTHSYGAIIYVYTDDIEGGGDPYTPPGTVDPTSWDELITDFTSFMVPLVVILLPAMLLMFLTRRTDKWLLLIGITVGAGLGYYFGMVPLWLVFLVTIGLIGMAYQSVRGGNS